MRKRVLSTILVMCMLLAILPAINVPAYAAAVAWNYAAVDIDSDTEGDQYFSAGNGTSEAPYEIDTAQELANLSYLINNSTPGYCENTVYYILTADIVLNDWTDDGDGVEERLEFSNSSGPALPWTPIGYDDTLTPFVGFVGNFNGSGHTVSGIYINKTDSDTDLSDQNQGLFGVLGDELEGGFLVSGTIQNVGIVNSYIRGYKYVGGIAGRIRSGTIQGCYNAAFVAAIQGAGGIVGIGNAGVVTKCFNIGIISGIGSNAIQIGGIVGQNVLNISYCYNAGNISGFQSLGGIAGVNAFGTVQYSFNSGNIRGTNEESSRIGSIAGSDFSALNPDQDPDPVSGYVSSSTTYCFYDKQMCTSFGIGGTLGSTSSLVDETGNTEGILTNGMLGDSLRGSLGIESNWTFTEGLYPRLAGMDTTDAAYVLATPIFLYDNSAGSENDYEACSNVTKDFTLGILNSIEWTSGDTSIISVTGDAADITGGNNSSVTLTAARNGLSKAVTLNSVTLYRCVTYSLNGGIGTLPTQSDLAHGSQFTTAPNTGFSRTGYTFDSWRFGSNRYGANSIYNNIITDVDFTALWKANAPSSAPTLDGKTATTITVTAVPGQEYSIDSGFTWQSSNTFSGLSARTEYTIVSRIAASGSDYESDAGPELTVTTNAPAPRNNPSRTITVTETSSALFSNSQGTIRAQANMIGAFSASVEVKVTDTDEHSSDFGLSVGNTVHPFDISLYIKGTDTKTQPKEGYCVTIFLPIPDELLDVKDKLSVVHKSDDETVTTLLSRLEKISGIWYLVFEATEFSPYALVVTNVSYFEATSGVPYYLNDTGKRVFIGLAADGKYIAPPGVDVSIISNTKSFADVSGHWAKDYIEFVTEREIFLGTKSDVFSPDSGMTRAMFSTVIGRLYERSFGEIKAAGAHTFTDCDYDDYYGKYVDWASENNILSGYGSGSFGPEDHITREQMAAILYRFADFINALPSDIYTVLNYPDAREISDYATNAALYCQTTSIITGRDGGSFSPQATATRAEVTAIIKRFIESVLA